METVKTLGKPKTDICQPHLAHKQPNLQFSVQGSTKSTSIKTEGKDASDQTKGGGKIQLKESGDNLKTKPCCHLPWSRIKMLRAQESNRKKSQES